jgi:hypothetical protein
MHRVLRQRYDSWKEIFWRKAVGLIAAAYFLLGLWDLFKSEFLPEEYQSLTIVKVTPHWSWRTWVIGMLLITVLVLLEGAHAAIQKRNNAIEQLTIASKTGIPPYHPKIVADRYGHQGTAYGLFIANDGYPAYQISIPDVFIGASTSRLTFSRTLARLIDKQGDQFFEAWIEDSDHTGRAGSALHEAMVNSNTDVVTVGIIYNDGEYKDGEFSWYRSNCAIARDSSAREGLTVSFLSQELIPKPSTN